MGISLGGFPCGEEGDGEGEDEGFAEGEGGHRRVISMEDIEGEHEEDAACCSDDDGGAEDYDDGAEEFE